MVAVWALNGATISEDGVVTLSDGRVFDLSSVPGNGYNANRMSKINEAAQEYLDKRDPITSLPPEDPDRIHAEAGDTQWFLDTYGNRMFIDGSDIVTRTTTVELTYNGVGLDISFATVR